MHCRNCRTELIAGKPFCHVCGVRGAGACGQCGATLEDAFRFCPDCGTATAKVAGPVPAGGVAGVTPDQLPLSAPALPVRVPDFVARNLPSARAGVGGERKQVTVLFCDLAGSTALAARLDPEDYRELLEEYLELAFRAIYQYEGIVNQLAGDGFMALFGAPVAHEDAPQRAVHAALEIQAALTTLNAGFAPARALDLRARIGIHTGPVVVGAVGNDLKMDYSAIGDTTNLAARLEALADPGSVLVSEATWRLIRGRFHARAVGPLTVKGKTLPITAYAVLGLTAMARAEPSAPLALSADRALTPFVGRESELAQLLGCYERLHERLPQLAVVVGPPGSGKSRLLHEFKQRLRDDAVAWFEARCSAWTQALPYAPFAGMLRRYFAVAHDQPPAAVRALVAQKVRDWDPDLDQIYPWLCRILAVADTDATALSDEAMKRGTFAAMGALMYRAAGSGPVIMLIEDAHWIDELSREMLYAAAGQLYSWPFMLLVTHRRDFRPDWGAQPVMTQFNLRRLDDVSITNIVRSLAGGPLPDELEQRIRQKAEGSPFLAEEITRTLIDDGSIDCTAEPHCIVHPIANIRIPDTVQEVLAARLDRLSADAKRVAQIAAVIGRQFDRRLLLDLLRDDSIDVDQELAELEQRGVIHRRDIFSRDEYRFGESLTQEVAYEGLLLRQRRQIHERIGGLLEVYGESQDSEHSAKLLHHFSLSENLDKTIEALLRLAADAEKVPSYATAARFYRQAWDRAQRAGTTHPDATVQARALQAVVGIGRMAVIYSVADPGDNAQVFVQARVLAAQTRDFATLAALHSSEGMLLMQRGPAEFSAGLATVEAGLALARQSPDPLSTVMIQRALAYGYMLDGRLASAAETLDVMLEQLTVSGHAEPASDLYLSARWMRARVHFLNDEYPRALESAQTTVALAISVGNRTIRASATALIAQVAFKRAEYADAARGADAAFSVISVIGPHINGAVTAAIAVLANLALGRREGLRPYIDFIDQNATPLNDLALNAHLVTEALLAFGEDAIADHRAALAGARAGGRLREMQAQLALAAVSLRRGRAQWPEAGRHYRQALALARELGMRSAVADALAGCGELAAVQGATADAVRCYAQAAEIWRELKLPHYLRVAEARLASLDQSRGGAA